MEFFARRSFAVTNVASLTMYFGMFGSIFFLAQFLQNVLGNTPLQAGLKMLVWTGATMAVAPFAGVFSERLGSRPFMVAGLALQAGALAWLASILSTHMAYSQMIIPFIMAGAGMALVFAPSASAILASVRPDQAGQASGANNAIREVGGVLGVAVLASVFTSKGGYASPHAFLAGVQPALWVGVAVLGAGALTVLALPFGRPEDEREAAAADPAGGRGARAGRARRGGRGRVSRPGRRVPAAAGARRRAAGGADLGGRPRVRTRRAARDDRREHRPPRRRRTALRVHALPQQARAVPRGSRQEL